MMGLAIDLLDAVAGRRIEKWQHRRRTRRQSAGHERGENFCAPCVVRVQSSPGNSRWRQGYVEQQGKQLVWKPHFGFAADTYALPFGSARFLLVRSPTDKERWLISKDVVVYRIRTGDHLLDIGLPGVDAGRFRELLEAPDGP